MGGCYPSGGRGAAGLPANGSTKVPALGRMPDDPETSQTCSMMRLAEALARVVAATGRPF